jgi:hypothetical protein
VRKPLALLTPPFPLHEKGLFLRNGPSLYSGLRDEGCCLPPNSTYLNYLTLTMLTATF